MTHRDVFLARFLFVWRSPFLFLVDAQAEQDAYI